MKTIINISLIITLICVFSCKNHDDYTSQVESNGVLEEGVEIVQPRSKDHPFTVSNKESEESV